MATRAKTGNPSAKASNPRQVLYMYITYRNTCKKRTIPKECFPSSEEKKNKEDKTVTTCLSWLMAHTIPERRLHNLSTGFRETLPYYAGNAWAHIRTRAIALRAIHSYSFNALLLAARLASLRPTSSSPRRVHRIIYIHTRAGLLTRVAARNSSPRSELKKSRVS